MPAKPSPSVNDIIEGLKASKNEKPKPAAEKPAQQDLLGSVLKDVAKMKPSGAAVQGAQTEGKGAAPAGAALSGTGTQSGGFGGEGSSRLTITEEDALRRQIEQCWNPPVGARDAQSLVVEVVIDVNADRTVSNAEVVDKFKYATDPFFRAAADAAIRAVRNPKCNPLELAPDKYEQWKRINFTFDPRDML
jgi:outer membrane biosynthesis protein TonB